MSLGIGLVIGLCLVMIAVMPLWPYSKGWGLKPSSAFAFLLGVVLLMLAAGEL